MSTEIHYENGTLTVTRVYDAPREAVFEAWVETSKVEKWWGCGQTTHVKSEIDPQVGGVYKHTMTLDGAGEHAADFRITEYDPPQRLAFIEAQSMEGMEPGRLEVDFTEVAGGTRVQLIHHNVVDEFAVYVKAGWTAAFDKLAGFLTAAV